MQEATLREILTNAVRFWERVRIGYNAVLAVVFVTVYFYNLPGSSSAISVTAVERVFMAAFMANFFYSFAYLPDIFVQLSGFRDRWLKLRWGLFGIGLVFASIWVQFISTAMFTGAK